MATRFDNIPTTDILRDVATRLRAERGQLDALANQTSSALSLLQVRGKPAFGDSLARLRALGQPTQTLSPRGLANEPRGARIAPPTPAPAASGRPVVIRLPNNRQVRGYIAPDAAHREDVDALRRVMAANTSRAFAAIQQNAQAIDALSRSVRELAIIVAELQARGNPALLQGLLESIEGLDLRMRKQIRAVGTQQASLNTQLQLQARSAQIQTLTTTSSMMQTAAFGTPGNPLARNNLLIAGNNLVWSFLGNALEGLGFVGPGQTSALAWLSPIVSLAVSQATLGRGPQPQRFLTGVATDFRTVKFGVEDLRQVFKLSLLERLPEDKRESFRRRENISVSATLQKSSPFARVSGFVVNGVLNLVVVNNNNGNDDDEGGGPELRVAWMVDTEDPDARR